MLRIVDQQASAFLRQRMEKPGCAFDFLVLVPEASDAADEVLHRQAVDPRYTEAAPPTMDWDLSKTVATPLDRTGGEHDGLSCRPCRHPGTNVVDLRFGG
ncbi:MULTISPECIES: hypothetical protein [unclassified Pseudomonas]|uniref:hypothetical protein n=1 Tax=unclassified Pseudomonas TaxID=196821 RepID=UPI0030D8573B